MFQLPCEYESKLPEKQTAYITKKQIMQFGTILQFEANSEKSKLQVECIPRTTSHRYCLFIQPAVEAKKFVQVVGTECRHRYSGQCCGSCVVCLRRIPPSFPPDKWTVHDATMTHGDRINNVCESWNGFRQLVGHSHPGVWTTIESLQLDQAMSVTSLMQQARAVSCHRAAAEAAAQAVLQLRRRQHCYGCVLARDRTYR